MIVMTLVIRDEVDLVDAHVAYHLNAGVDFVIATDHRSVDGTTEVLESYARDGVLRLIREQGDLIRQDVWQTRMSRLAASEYGADWVISSDADEFWWPRQGSLKDVLHAVPTEYGVVRAYSHSFLPRVGTEWFPERMTIRLASAAINDPGTPYRPVAKVAFRASRRVVVGWGNHRVSGIPLPALRGWSPVDILHFPVRSPEQIARKYRTKATAWEAVNLRGDLARAKSVFEQRRPEEAIYGRLVVDDTTVQRGLEAGLLVEDTRLRDALRTLRGPNGFVRPVPGAKAISPSSSPADHIAHALDVAVLDGADLVRTQRRLDAIAIKVETLERKRRRGAAGRWLAHRR
jgi:hypothetical protein